MRADIRAGVSASAVGLFESFSEKVSDMAKNDEDEVGDVGCYQVKVRRFVHDGLRDGCAFGMFTNMSMRMISDPSELCVFLCFFLPVARIIWSRRRSRMVIFCPGG